MQAYNPVNGVVPKPRLPPPNGAVVVPNPPNEVLETRLGFIKMQWFFL